MSREQFQEEKVLHQYALARRQPGIRAYIQVLGRRFCRGIQVKNNLITGPTVDRCEISEAWIITHLDYKVIKAPLFFQVSHNSLLLPCRTPLENPSNARLQCAGQLENLSRSRRSRSPLHRLMKSGSIYYILASLRLFTGSRILTCSGCRYLPHRWIYS